MTTFTHAGGPDDGIDGSTGSHNRNGVFGRNDDTTRRNAANPGGNGVFGFTQVPDGAGVFGAHNTGGIGVAGIARGDTGVGVKGHADRGDGVQGSTAYEHRNGVFGRNDSITPRNAADPGGNGVFGFSQVPDGAGVFGASAGGIGIVGQSDVGDEIQGFTASNTRNGIFGRNTSPSSVRPGQPAPVGNGVFGFTDCPNGSGIVGAIGPTSSAGAGVTGIGSVSNNMAGE